MERDTAMWCSRVAPALSRQQGRKCTSSHSSMATMHSFIIECHDICLPTDSASGLITQCPCSRRRCSYAPKRIVTSANGRPVILPAMYIFLISSFFVRAVAHLGYTVKEWVALCMGVETCVYLRVTSNYHNPKHRTTSEPYEPQTHYQRGFQNFLYMEVERLYNNCDPIIANREKTNQHPQ